jgi:general secretion pathway protein E
VHRAVVSRIKTVARLDIAEKRRPQDGRVKTERRGQEVELRVSTLPVAFGEKIVMRIFDPETFAMELPQIGFFPDEMDSFNDFISRPHGIILITGPTGSGKTTTLYSALRTIATREINITTIEDPIEIVCEEFNQIAVQTKIGITFAEALRYVLRQDPDVIMVGEIRDQETAQYAIQAALTGHLVFSTLHTNDAPSALTRLIDMGVKPFLVSTAVMAIMAQRLIRRLCKSCRKPFEPTAVELRSVGLTPDSLTGRTVYKPVGFDDCNGTGYRGRVGVYELFAMDSTLREQCFRGASTLKLREQAKISGGLVSLMDDGIRKFLAGETTLDEVLTVAISGEAVAA